MNIAVIAGGLSPERDVSLSSGAEIANALAEAGYDVCLIDLYTGEKLKKTNGKYAYAVPPREPDLEKIRRDSDNDNSLIGKNVIELCRRSDLAFLALHGDIGENGKLQAVFDSFGIAYTGTGYMGSLVAMDKDLAKTLMVSNQILTPDWKITGEGTDENIGMEFPLVIKPCSCGSSVGVSIAENKEEYIRALECAKKYEKKIMIEKMIAGREFSVGILDGGALPPIEIIPDGDFFDYEHKYQPGITKEICPAEIDGDIAEQMQKTALRVHKILGLGSYSRIDFILGRNGGIYCLEANTLPGMTPNSLLPKEAAAAGISYVDLCDKIAKMALEDFKWTNGR
ncbi:MAG: D-alanine--D-alanine ligase [Oscillospiraceae bacterium]|nr:D-alanine--D-alanine ligase [Oscillospiraceae bacterium]